MCVCICVCVSVCVYVCVRASALVCVQSEEARGNVCNLLGLTVPYRQHLSGFIIYHAYLCCHAGSADAMRSRSLSLPLPRFYFFRLSLFFVITASSLLLRHYSFFVISLCILQRLNSQCRWAMRMTSLHCLTTWSPS
jgi:hypothetical protein